MRAVQAPSPEAMGGIPASSSPSSRSRSGWRRKMAGAWTTSRWRPVTVSARPPAAKATPGSMDSTTGSAVYRNSFPTVAFAASTLSTSF